MGRAGCGVDSPRPAHGRLPLSSARPLPAPLRALPPRRAHPHLLAPPRRATVRRGDRGVKVSAWCAAAARRRGGAGRAAQLANQRTQLAEDGATLIFASATRVPLPHGYAVNRKLGSLLTAPLPPTPPLHAPAGPFDSQASCCACPLRTRGALMRSAQRGAHLGLYAALLSRALVPRARGRRSGGGWPWCGL